MPSKEQDMFDISYVFESIDSFTESIEKHFESVSSSLKDTFRASPWLPDSIKPRPPPSPRRMPVVPMGYLEASRNWVSEHRAVTAGVIAFVGTGAFIIWRRRRSDGAKRRARRAKNGSRTEVVILVGSPHSPLTRSLSSDLERRGFIVYIPVSGLSEEQLVQSESRSDIRPLNFDITSPSSTEETIQKLHTHLTTPQNPISNAPSHTLHLTSLIFLPGSPFPTGPVTSLSPAIWSDTLNTRLLAPFTAIHAFLPLLISQSSSLLFLSPSITPSLAPPCQAAESVVAGGLQQYISTLRKEVASQGVNVVQFQLGYFDYGYGSGEQQQLVLNQHLSRAEITSQRLEQKQAAAKKSPKGTSLRELHNGVFDTIVRGKGRNGTVFIGLGSRTYDLVGKLVPNGILGWMTTPRKAHMQEKLESERSPERSAEWERVSDDEGYVYPRRR